MDSNEPIKKDGFHSGVNIKLSKERIC